MCMQLQKFDKNEKKQLAVELLCRDPNITQRQLADQLKVNKNTVNSWYKDPEFIDRIYDHFMVLAGKHLPSVVMSLINEAKEGNVRAAELVLKHFNKLQDRVHVEINAPFMQFINNSGSDQPIEIEAEDAKIIAENIEIQENPILPARNPNANSPKNPKNSLNKQKIGYKHKRYKNDINSRYKLRKRAKAVGLKSMGSGKPKENERKNWLKKLIDLEKQQDIWYADHDHYVGKETDSN